MPEAPQFCGACGGSLAPDALVCPQCQTLVYAEQLERLSQRARTLLPAEAIPVWQEALTLLPPESKQAAAIRDYITKLEADVRTGAGGSSQGAPNWTKKLGPLGVVIAFLLKFKTVGLLLLTKAKFLFFGLSKLQTLLSMLATMGLYWSWYGWKFAVGFVLGIYVHEMGHIWALSRFGLRASAPMFIPGFGAFVSLYDSPADEGQDARIGLAGPIWGAGAAIACLALQSLAMSNIWFAIARATATINLFNLVPIWQLDGGRGFRALGKQHRISILVLCAILWFVTAQGMFFLILLGAGYRSFFSKDLPKQTDTGILYQFSALLVLFGAMLALLPVSR